MVLGRGVGGPAGINPAARTAASGPDGHPRCAPPKPPAGWRPFHSHRLPPPACLSYLPLALARPPRPPVGSGGPLGAEGASLPMSAFSLRRAGRLLLNPIGWSAAVLLLAGATAARASEADLAIPDLHQGHFFNGAISAWNLLFYGSFVICGTLGFSLYLRGQIHKLPAHRSMLNVAEIIYQTCKTYLLQQGKFLLMLFALIAVAITFYLLFPVFFPA